MAKLKQFRSEDVEVSDVISHVSIYNMPQQSIMEQIKEIKNKWQQQNVVKEKNQTKNNESNNNQIQMAKQQTEQKYKFDKSKLSPQRIKDSEAILRSMFPDQKDEWIKLSNIMHQERQFIDKQNKQNENKNCPIEFQKYHLQEVEVSEAELRTQIINLIDQCIPNKQYGKIFIQNVMDDLRQFNKNQLQKTNDIISFIVNNIEIKKKTSNSPKVKKQKTFNMNNFGLMVKKEMQTQANAITMKKELGLLADEEESQSISDKGEKKELNTFNRQNCKIYDSKIEVINETDSEQDQFEEKVSKSTQQMQHKINKVLKHVKKELLGYYTKQQEEQKRKRKNRQLKLKKLKKRDQRELVAHDIIFTAYMMGLEELLKDIFGQDESLNFSNSFERVNNEMPGGVFRNRIVRQKALRLQVPFEDMQGFIQPSLNGQIQRLSNNLTRIGYRYPMINQNSLNKGFDYQLKRIMPLVKSDGTLFIVQRLINKEYAGQICKFIQDVQTCNELLRNQIKSIVIDEVQIEESQLISIFQQFLCPKTKQTSIRHLTMGNILVNQELMYYILSQVLPSLYSIDLFSLKSRQGLRQNQLFTPLRELIDNFDDRCVLMRLRISNIDLNQEFDLIIDLIEYAQDALLDLELSRCNLDLNNFIQISNCIKSLGEEDADRFNDGIRRGVFRKLDFSYNPFLSQKEKSKIRNADILEQMEMIVVGDSFDLNDTYSNNVVSGKNKSTINDQADIDGFQCKNESDMDSDDDSYLDSFPKALINLIRSQYLKICTHLDLSGIQSLKLENILEVANELVDHELCENLLSVHMNDLGINMNQKIKEEITEIFRVQTNEDQKIAVKPNLYTAFKIFIEKVRGGEKFKRDNAKNFNYVQTINKALGYTKPNTPINKQYNFFLAQQLQLINEQKSLKNAGYLIKRNGIGRSNNDAQGIDRFLLTRKSNYVPELIFNQNPNQDVDKNRRFFELDHESKWKMSDYKPECTDTCYICDQQKYTMIFYQRDKTSFLSQKNINLELIEIHDQSFIAKLRSEYNLKYSQMSTSLKKMTTPLIFGTPIRSSQQFVKTSNITDLTFDRKLRMVRVDLFALMSCCQNSEFIKDANESVKIKKSLYNFLKGEMNSRVQKLDTFKKLQGWNRLMHQKCNLNYVYSVHNVNQPECISNKNAKLEPPGDSHYVFATYLKPGYHQFFIYDPQVEKVYCQEVVIELDNCIQIYPEIPKLNKELITAVLPPVFKKWIRDDIDRENKAYYIDTTPFKEQGAEQRDNFEPERFIKSPQDLEACETIIKQNFKFFQIYFQESIAESYMYPEIDLPTFLDKIQRMLKGLNKNADVDNQFILKNAEIEIQFISATRHDTKSGRSLCRGEYLELMLRIVHLKYRQIQNKNRKNSYRRESINMQQVLNSQQKNAFLKIMNQVDFGPKEGYIGENRKPITIQTHLKKIESDSIKSPNKLVESSMDRSPITGVESNQFQKIGELIQDNSKINNASVSNQAHQNNPPTPGLKLQGNKITNVLKLTPKKQHSHDCQGYQITQQPEMNKSTILKGLASHIEDQVQTDTQNELHKYLETFVYLGLGPYCEQGPILLLRKQIQDDPLVVRELALRLKELKKLFEHYTVRGIFKFENSALRLFEMQGMNLLSQTNENNFWYPLCPKDLWSPFVHCMMTILDEIHQEQKYDHILLVEFYEWIARIAFKYSELKKALLPEDIRQGIEVFRHEQVANFLEKLLERFYSNVINKLNKNSKRRKKKTNTD